MREYNKKIQSVQSEKIVRENVEK